MKLIVRDKNRIERQVTQKAYDLVGKRHGYQIIGKVEPEKSDYEKEKDRLRAEKAMKSPETATADTATTITKEVDLSQEKPEGKKRGPKPKIQE